MKCVQRINCDFNGVMTNEVFNLTPDLEMLRVPLIPCVNRQRQNSIDVCCRDPNYKDPWPNMNTKTGKQNKNGVEGQNGDNAAKGNFQLSPSNVNNDFQAVPSNTNSSPSTPKKKKGYGRK